MKLLSVEMACLFGVQNQIQAVWLVPRIFQLKIRMESAALQLPAGMDNLPYLSSDLLVSFK